MQSWFSSYISFNYGQNSKLIAGKLYYQIHATKPITHKTHQNYSNKTHHTQNPSKVIKQNPSKMEVSHHKMQQNNITKTWERKIERTKLRDSYLREKTKRTTERGRERAHQSCGGGWWWAVTAESDGENGWDACFSFWFLILILILGFRV